LRIARGAKPHADDEVRELPPHGQILLVDLIKDVRRSRGDAVSDRLLKYANRSTPLVGILLDLGETDYRFTSSDLATVVGLIAAWKRGWVAPCAVVVKGGAATVLRSQLEMTQLTELPQLRIFDSKDEGLRHIERCLAERGA